MRSYQIIDLRDKEISASVRFCVLNKSSGQLVVFYGLAGFKNWEHLMQCVGWHYKLNPKHDEVVEALERAKPEWMK